MRRNYFICVIVSFIMAFLTGGPISLNENIDTNMQLLSNIAQNSGSKELMIFSNEAQRIKDEIVDATSFGEQANSGVLAGMYRDTQRAGSPEIALVEGINNAFFRGEIGRSVINFLGVLFSVLVYIFVYGLLRIGVCRFYLETRLYPKTGLSRILFIYKLRRILEAGGAVAWKALWLLIWGITIVGLPIKYYSYYLMPYIVAENPDIGARQALRLSIQLMQGNKLRAFLFDLSFVGWQLLSIPTFGLLRYFYIEPYIWASRAELYMNIRAVAKAQAPITQLNDKYLETAFESEDATAYPVHLFSIPEHKGRRWLNTDYHVRYSPVNLILMFFIFALIGWLWECSLELVQGGMLVNRGTLYGPWLPIYGIGGVSVLLLFHKIVDRPVLTFLLVTLSCGIIEYVGAWALETFWHLKYWDYSGYFFNIQGRVCLEGLLVFAIAGTASIYVLSPIMNNLLEKIPLRFKRGLCALFVLAFGTDLVYTAGHPHTGAGITSEMLTLEEIHVAAERATDAGHRIS